MEGRPPISWSVSAQNNITIKVQMHLYLEYTLRHDTMGKNSVIDGYNTNRKQPIGWGKGENTKNAFSQKALIARFLNFLW